MDRDTEAGTPILVFAKAPIAGHSKTRLIEKLGASGAAALQARLIEHTLGVAQSAAPGRVQLWCSPDTTHPFLQACAERFGVALRAQCDGDIGTRMLHAFAHTLPQARAALLIGTDCPSMDVDDLSQASHALAHGHDAVLLPVEDGGYTLIGLRVAAAQAFDGIDWSTPEVMAQTRARLRALNWRWLELDTKWDLDRPEDLERVRAHWPELLP